MNNKSNNNPIKPDGFCEQCKTDLFGEDEPNDLSDLVTPAQSKELLFANVLCEGCGYTSVDHAGVCVSADCHKQHGDY